jgi:hypothetical protein
LIFIVACETASFYAGSGANCHFLSGLLRAKISCHAASSVAGYFSLGAIGIEQARTDIRILRREKPLHAVSTYACVPVANAVGEAHYVCRSVHTIDDEEIVPAGISFHKRNVGRGWAHSASLLPNNLTLEKTPDSCSATFNSSS